MSYNTIDDFRDINTPNSSSAYAPSASVWSFAWALHAGLGIQVTDNLTMDLGYSFTNLGNAQTGGLQSTFGSACALAGTCSPVTFKNIYSHDLKFGLRYAFDTAPKYYGPAVVKY